MRHAGATYSIQHASTTRSNSNVSGPPPAIAYVSGNNAGPTNTASLVVNAPASIVNGNLLICVQYQANGTAVFGAPSGWVTAGNMDDSVSSEMQVWSKVATGAEPSTYTFTSSKTGLMTAVILQYKTASAVDGVAAFTNGAVSTTQTYPSVTPTKTGDMWIVFQGNQSGGTNVPTTPSGFTARDFVGNTVEQLRAFEKGPLVGTSPTGTTSSTTGTAQNNQTGSVLIKQ